VTNVIADNTIATSFGNNYTTLSIPSGSGPNSLNPTPQTLKPSNPQFTARAVE